MCVCGGGGGGVRVCVYVCVRVCVCVCVLYAMTLENMQLCKHIGTGQVRRYKHSLLLSFIVIFKKMTKN